ncbi:hypothetical protein S40285_05556 [Stachybotrys chlorohalonatus IBT 40285]|uniref:Uncharacterized protein n=1 Tax=Stachybotrys chlorohalonatus (strain IBT 40285) TaxID=1283841 RepID=A0A084QFI1_STAC4|nr:hypothetical protein S40285_05556 [Stachybotrys chlorohalonata IBT 40285]
MAATVAHNHSAALPPASNMHSSPHPTHTLHSNPSAAPAAASNGGASPDPLPATRKFKPSDFTVVRTLGTG